MESSPDKENAERLPRGPVPIAGPDIRPLPEETVKPGPLQPLPHPRSGNPIDPATVPDWVMRGEPTRIEPPTEAERRAHNDVREAFGLDPLPAGSMLTTAESILVYQKFGMVLDPSEVPRWQTIIGERRAAREIANKVAELPGYLGGKIDNRTGQMELWVADHGLARASQLVSNEKLITVRRSAVAIADLPEFRKRLEARFDLAQGSFQIQADPRGWIVVLDSPPPAAMSAEPDIIEICVEERSPAEPLGT